MTTKMIKFEAESAVSVSEFFDRHGDRVLAFDDAKHADKQAIANMRSDIASALDLKRCPRSIKFISAQFVEFDSANPTHAGAIFTIRMSAPERVIKPVQDALGA